MSFWHFNTLKFPTPLLWLVTGMCGTKVTALTSVQLMLK